jgi:peptidoglycan/LPS O-acetylase OafA/YrhL
VIALVVHLLYIAQFWNKPIDVGVVASNLLLLHGIWELKIEPIIMPTWSLAYEWLFYIAFPAVLLLPQARSRISYWHIAFCGLLVLLFVAPVAPYYMRFLMFLVGAALATTSSATLRRSVARIPDAAVIFVYVAANLVFVASQNWYHFIPVYLFTSTALVTKAVYGDGLLHRLFCWHPLRWIGNVSYSFYLFHGLALVAFCDHVGPHLGGLPEALRFFSLLAGSFALSLAVARISYTCFERPYFQWRAHKDNHGFPGLGTSVQKMA